ncbi:alpha/beta hydrolase [Arthrobacter sp. ISL-69]|uniref:alpha/beta fold hydrolase n=1 Tax=Arthrobacter sp. ISL-69 TaxID=2819113 RepID=UPI00288C5448|nr:alpha/beta hydrolase [Arthrobacter sp. ISL-69]
MYSHSMGGRIAQWLAIDHPQSVRALILAATSGGKLARASREHDAWSRLGSIQSPTLILHGTDDALTPLPNAVQLHWHIRRSTLVKVPGAGHNLHLDLPETLRWIRQFIAAKDSR